jgi:WD40 repeat protein
VWTADGTHVIGGGGQYHHLELTQRRTTTHLEGARRQPLITTLSLSPTGTHLATSNWGEKTAFVFDISTGEQVAAFKHSQNSNGIAYSPSGKFIATGCDDKKVYVWEAPAFEDPQTKVSFILVAFTIVNHFDTAGTKGIFPHRLLPQRTNRSPSRAHHHSHGSSMYAHESP